MMGDCMVKAKDAVKLSEGAKSIILTQKRMEVGRNYSISFVGSDYNFRKTTEGEIEIYVKSLS